MEDKVILKEAIQKRRTTQRAIAEKMGISQSLLSGNMTRNRMGMDNFRTILNAMDYDVCVVDRRTGKVEWTVTE